MRRLWNALVDGLGSLALSSTLVLLLFVLTYLGTVYQVEHGIFEAQKTYFDSWWLSHRVTDSVSVPLPGGQAVMMLLFVNLLVGGVLRLKIDARRFGILVTHLGIGLMLVAGFVKLEYAEEGALHLYEGEQGSAYRSYHDWEISILSPGVDGTAQENLIPQDRFASLTDDKTASFSNAQIPFELEVSHYMPNARPLPKGPMFEVDVPVLDGFFLEEQALDSAAERNMAGCYATLRSPGGEVLQEGILWGASRAPMTFAGADGQWKVDLRKKLMPLPFTVVLDKTARELHPGTMKPRSYMSDVTLIDEGIDQEVRIQMNEPLRHEGFVLYQSGWGPDDAGPGSRLYSVFSVVRNPADNWPLYSCIVITIGLLLHFTQALFRHMRRELGATA